mgnify:CR=1 FL=1
MRKRAVFSLVIVGVMIGLLAAAAAHLVAPPPHAATAANPRPLPVPTFTPTPTHAPEDYAYQAANMQQRLAEALVQVAGLVGAPRLEDAAWHAQVTAAMHNVENAYGGLLGLAPPAPWRSFHAQLLSGAADCNAAMRVLALALDERQPATVSVVAALLARCEESLHLAQELTDAQATPSAARP